jgi:hypothetical protein
VGDLDDKTFCFYKGGRARIRLTHTPHGGSGHGRLSDYANPEERDRARSSWRRIPFLSGLVVAAAHDPLDVEDPPSFDTMREQFAVAWHQAHLPVPYDYDARDDAQPLLPEDRDYLARRGKG